MVGALISLPNAYVEMSRQIVHETPATAVVFASENHHD